MEKRNYKLEYKWWENLEKKTKLEQAFAIGCKDSEACAYAEISLDQLYYYTSTVNKEFQVRKDELKLKPILKARQTVVGNLSDPDMAFRYLERRVKDEFASRTENTGAEGGAIKTYIIMDGTYDTNTTDNSIVDSTPSTETNTGEQSEV